MAYSYEQIIEALRNADAAGNTEDAQRLAELAVAARSEQQKQPESSGMLQELQQLAMKKTQEPILPSWFTEFQSGVTKGIVDPFIGAAQMGLEAAGQGEAGKKMVESYNKALGPTGTAGEIAGGFASPINAVLGPLATASKPVMVGRAVGAGAVQGALQPTENTESYWTDRAFNAGVGAVISGAFPVASLGSQKVKQILGNVNLTTKARMAELREYLLKALGPEADQAIQQLKAVGENVIGSKPTASQALAESPSSLVLGAVEQQLSKKQDLSPMFAAREASQQEARKAALEGIATPDQRTIVQLENTRKEATDKLRNDALAKANKYGTEGIDLERKLADRQQSYISALQGEGRLATEESQALNRAHTWTPVPGYPRFPGRYSPNMDRAIEYRKAAEHFGDIVDTRKAEINFTKAQLKQLNDEGFFPLSPDIVISRLTKAKNLAGDRANEELTTIYSDVIDKLNQFTNARGVIDSNDLYQIRKDLGKDMTNSLQKRNMKADEKRIAGIERSVQKMIDSTIEQAGAKGMWNKYLNNYARYSKLIDRRKVGQALADKLGGKFDIEAAGAFATAIQNSRSLLAEATGKTYPGTIEKVLTPKEMATVNSVLADLSRAKKAKEMAGKVTLDTEDGLPSLTVFSQAVTTTKDLLRYLKEGKKKEVDRKMAELVLNPQQLATFLEAVPASKFETLMPALLKNMSPELANQMMSRFGVATASAVLD